MTSLAARPSYSSDFDIQSALSWIRSEAEWIGLRYVNEATHHRYARDGRSDKNSVTFERGVMVEALVDGQIAYGATSDLSREGIVRAAKKAAHLARSGGGRRAITQFTEKVRPQVEGKYRSPYQKGLDTTSLKEFSDQLIQGTRHLKVSDKIVNAIAEAILIETTFKYATTNCSFVEQDFLGVASNFAVTAMEAGQSQRRSINGPVARTTQSGIEAFRWNELFAECERVGREAVELLAAPDCPNETMDLILMPDQMLLQIHESIGHPLELDRILGDEKNFAGWSFVKPQDFGRLQYGSSIMNVTFDPSVSGEFASYGFDDCGNTAQREHLIKDGLLVRGLGSLESQSRLGLPGVANFRSASWSRAPIDRMANINLEPGSSSLAEMISQTERGIVMEANISWSIDDYRNKFQFGCEYARLIENGQLTKVVKNPNYRGISVPFWNKLKMVGRKQEIGIFGTPYCGKGEPSQIIRVGHSSPPCLFEKVEVFGGGK